MGAIWPLLVWLQAWANGASPFPDTPANHWVYVGLAEAKRDGLLVGYPDGLVYHEPPKTRYGMTLPLLFAMERYRDLAATTSSERLAIESLPTSDEGRSRWNSDAEIVLKWHRHLPFFRRAQFAFLPQVLELQRIDPRHVILVAEVERAANRVQAFAGERREPFFDVPRDHWAFDSVRDLRAWRLIDGYPGRRFGN